MNPSLDSGMMWCGEKALKEAFLDLYSIDCVKDASVAVHLEWNVSVIRVAHDWEVDVLASFFNLLY
jgi:hypothetical protein